MGADAVGRQERRAGRRQHQHRTGRVGGAERGEGPAPGLGVGDDHGGERVARGRLEGGLPALVDLDQVEQRAEDAVDLGEALRPGTGAGLVERERQRLGPGRPRVLVGVGAAADLLGPRRPPLG